MLNLSTGAVLNASVRCVPLGRRCYADNTEIIVVIVQRLLLSSTKRESCYPMEWEIRGNGRVRGHGLEVRWLLACYPCYPMLPLDLKV